MEFERRIQNEFNLDSARLRQFLRDTVLYVIANDPSLDEDARARVRSLRIPEGERDRFSSQVGPFIIRQLRSFRSNPDYESEIRIFARILIFIASTLDEFISYFSYYVSKRCQQCFKTREPRPYFHFLATICEICCKIAEVDQCEGYILLVIQRAELYMSTFWEVFPGYQVLADYAEMGLQSEQEY